MIRLTWISLACFLCACCHLRGQAFFPQAAVGSGNGVRSEVQLELSLVVEGNPALSLVKRQTRAEGLVRFLTQTGQPMQVLANGEGLQDQTLSEIPFKMDFFGGPVNLRWSLRSAQTDQELSVFWAIVDVSIGEVDGLLQFDIRNSESGVILTSIPVPAIQKTNAGFFSALQDGPRDTGLAVANPVQHAVHYWALALNRDRSVAQISHRELPSRGQEALFVSELFPQLDGFDGFLAVVSAFDLAMLSLRQEDIQLSTTSSIDPNIIELPFAFGSVENFLERDELGMGDSPIRLGQITLSRPVEGETGLPQELNGDVSKDGKFLVGPLDEGNWLLQVEADQFCSLQRVIEFPATHLKIDLTDLSLVNPAFLSRTLRSPTHVSLNLEGTVIKPVRPFDFHFDASAFDPMADTALQTRIEAVRRAVRMWVWYELPQLRIGVEDEDGGGSFLGGRDHYFEGPSTSQLHSLRIIADPSLNQLITRDIEVGSGEGAGQVLRGTLRFNPDACDDCSLLPQEVSSRLWEILFLRSRTINGQVLQVADFKISGLEGEEESLAIQYTQISDRPQSMTSTPVDKNYWAVLRNRPAGTVIEEDKEELPRLKRRRPRKD